MPPQGHLPEENVNDTPFRFAHKLPLILTKLTPPRTPGALLQRDRLLAQLKKGSAATLTLVCAGAGFGKTTLLAQWYRTRQAQGDALAWLSLEEDDNDPALFMRYLLRALRPLYAGLDTLSARPEGDEPARDSAPGLAELTNALHACPHPLYLILDDFHCIHDPHIHEGIRWLLHHAPACLHLIMGSRTRLPFSLSRLRLQEQYVEIDDQALRFTLTEAQRYFAPSLTTQDIPQLHVLTEGWVAGMKMATLAPQTGARPHPLTGELRAGSRFIERYLDEVIFSPLPQAVVEFLMLTSVLNRLHPELCDTVTKSTNGAAMLHWIEQHNLFLSALDESGLWFRYHPLMRDALRKRLQQQGNVDIGQLHERAGNWFAAQQLWAEAIRHALAAGKLTLRHAEAGAQSLAEEGDIDSLVRWTRHFPATPDPSRVELQLNLAWALAHHFHFADARQLLDAIDSLTAEQPEAPGHSTRIKQRVVRAICEAFADNITGSIALVEPLLSEVPCGDVWVDGLVCNILAYCHLALGQPQRALDVQQRFPVGLQKNRNLFIEVYRAFVLSLAWFRQGNLNEAERQATQALQQAEQQTGPHSSSGATLVPVLAAIALERGDGQYAHSLLTPRLEMIDEVCPADGVTLCYLTLARWERLNGRDDKAQQLLRHAERLALQRGWWRARLALIAGSVTLSPVPGDILRVKQTMGELSSLARDKQNRVADWCRAVTQSHLLLLDNAPLCAAATLEPLVAEQEACTEWHFALRTRLLQAVALWRAGEVERAALTCQPALLKIKEHQMLQCLRDAGPDLLALLVRMRESRRFSTLVAELETLPGSPVTPETGAPRLTEREQQTLRLIANGDSNKAIARTLGISVETVKWHLKQLYEKLGVSGRIQAVNQARKLKMLTAPDEVSHAG
ncbi:LuxR C-terminal-related transcriptional regulator [Yokenella regensburgei]|uniref:LuxR C-terminal-related transcriptional regulator n=1 Tax=Yokenella regensburgei TaxID=158877 RepID=UPI003F5CCE4A